MKPILPITFCLLFAALETTALAAEKAAYDSNGSVIALLSPIEEFSITSSVVAVLPNGRRIPLQVRGPSGGATRQGSALLWSLTFMLPDGSKGRMELQSTEDPTSIRYSATVTAQTNLDVEAIELVIDLPRPAFLNGSLTADKAQRVVLGPIQPRNATFFSGQASTLFLEDRPALRSLDISFDQSRDVAVIDRWGADGRFHEVRMPLKRGPWASGMKAGVAITLKLTSKPTDQPIAHLTMDASNTRYDFQGFGGNYCWDNRSPIAAYTLDHLKIARARTAMNLAVWDKERNHPGAEIRADMEIMQRLQKMGVPIVMSIWTLPERFYTDPYQEPPSASRLIDPEKWNELADLISEYLLYAKRVYSVEPDLLSFNEVNVGVYISQTPESHARAVQRLGDHFRKLGLKTKMLLGDLAGPRDTHNFVLAAAPDIGLRDVVGAVGFHSWGGGSHEQYSAWGDLAQWLNLPLLVTEVGVDASAHYTDAWDNYSYGLREARMIQDLLTFARPQALLFWQYTDDYALARVRSNGSVEPTARFWIVKHFTDLTPFNAKALAAYSDQPSVLFTAFRGGGDYTMHILNLGAARSIEIGGVPNADWSVIETTEDRQYVEKPRAHSSAHRIIMQLPSRSLVTLKGVPVSTKP
jgi:hypothetical protein